MQVATLTEILRARAGKRACALLTELDSGAQRLVYADELAAGTHVDGLPAQLAEAIAAAIRSDRSRTVTLSGNAGTDVTSQTGAKAREVFIQVHNPPLKLYVIGAVHIAQALVPMASAVGYQVVVIDPRRSFATAERFEGVELDTEWPDEALAARTIDARTAIVTLTHDPKLDDPALQTAVRSDAFYIGSLGSRRTHASRLERLHASGIEPSATARIHGPIGLPIGARSPAEIAIAILAQMTQALRAEPAG